MTGDMMALGATKAMVIRTTAIRGMAIRGMASVAGLPLGM
jgi:hypothetical protein